MQNRFSFVLVLLVAAAVAAFATARARAGAPLPSLVNAPRAGELVIASAEFDAALPAGAAGDLAGGDAEAVLEASLVVPVAGVSPQALRGTFTDPRSGGREHQAIDIMAPRGTPVVSATAGRVLRLHRSRAGGLMVYAADTADRLILMYAHLDRYARGLVAGMPLAPGQLLGYVGSTGNATASAPHLHFAISRGEPSVRWWSGIAVDPFPLLASAMRVALSDVVAPAAPVERKVAAAPRTATRASPARRATSTRTTSARKPAVKTTTARKPAAKTTAARRPAVKAATARKPGVKAAPARKPAAKSAAARKPAARTAAARKPAAKKPVARQAPAQKVTARPRAAATSRTTTAATRAG